jgi:hypothetical protein
MTAPVNRSHPQLLTGLRPLWRNEHDLQLGLDPARGVVVEGLDSATARVLIGLDGRRCEAEVLADAAAAGLDVATVTQLLSGLRRCGVIVEGESAGPPALGGPDVAERLTPDCAALALAAPGRGPVGTLRRRR